MAFQARVTKANYAYAYAYRWDELAPLGSRQKAAKLFTGTAITVIADLEGRWQIEKLAERNGAYVDADQWWIDPLDCERIVGPVPEPEPEPDEEPTFGEGDLGVLVGILRDYGIKSITLE